MLNIRLALVLNVSLALVLAVLVFKGVVQLSSGDLIAATIFAVVVFIVVANVLVRLTEIVNQLKLLNSKANTPHSTLGHHARH